MKAHASMALACVALVALLVDVGHAILLVYGLALVAVPGYLLWRAWRSERVRAMVEFAWWTVTQK